MGISLITPVGSNFLKDFPSHNTVNLDRIDAYANASLISHPLKGYTPLFTAVTTNPVIGTGGSPVLRAFYYEIFDQIYTWGELRFGSSGASFGIGNWMMSLPFNAVSNVGFSTSTGNAPVIGTGMVYPFSTTATRQPVTVHLRTANTIMFGIRINSGAASRAITNVDPIAWAVSDGLSWNARFQRLP
jgi:hypothetical protein